MRRRLGRIAITSASVGILVAGAIGTAVPASAQDTYSFSLGNTVLQPGFTWTAVPRSAFGNADGTLVYAFATTPLTGGPGASAGLPQGLAFTANTASGCKPAPGATAVYLCRVVGTSPYNGPEISVSAQTPDDTTGYFGAAYAPAGTDLTATIREAQTAATAPADGRHGAASFTVKTPGHVAQNTLVFDAPDITAGKSTVQTLHVHARDAGQLLMWLRFSPGQVGWSSHSVDIRITSLTTGPAAHCTLAGESAAAGLALMQCEIAPGDTDLAYTVTAAAGTESWQMYAEARYQVYTYGSDYRTAQRPFDVEGLPVRHRYTLLGRDAAGRLWQYAGTGSAAAPYGPRSLIGGGWQAYSALTKLAPLAWDSMSGDVVARDRSGVLWYYRAVDGGPLAPRTRIGTGWNTYSSLTGTGDLTADGKPDLVARDTTGTLWLYQGTGKPTAPFTARTRIGTGWNTYSSFAAGADLTGDGKPDLVARDSTGILWLYQGTGKPTAPFAARTRVGAGWNTYNTLTGTGDLTADGKPDLVARDTTGTLWLYQGTGKPTAPFTTRTRIGTGWNTYNTLV